MLSQAPEFFLGSSEPIFRVIFILMAGALLYAVLQTIFGRLDAREQREFTRKIAESLSTLIAEVRALQGTSKEVRDWLMKLDGEGVREYAQTLQEIKTVPTQVGQLLTTQNQQIATLITAQLATLIPALVVQGIEKLKGATPGLTGPAGLSTVVPAEVSGR